MPHVSENGEQQVSISIESLLVCCQSGGGSADAGSRKHLALASKIAAQALHQVRHISLMPWEADQEAVAGSHGSLVLPEFPERLRPPACCLPGSRVQRQRSLAVLHVQGLSIRV